jgi:hypothetical protein
MSRPGPDCYRPAPPASLPRRPLRPHSLPAMRPLLLSLSLLALAACQDAEAPSPSDAAPAPTSTEAAPPAQDHAEGDHAHEAPHGGAVKTAGGGHLELVTEHTAFKLYVLDGNEQTLPVEGLSGAEALVQVDGGDSATIPLTPSGDHLRGELPAETFAYTAIVSVPVAGETRSARFEVGLDSHTQHAH